MFDEDMRATVVAQKARNILNWVKGTPNDNINSVETMGLAIDVLEHPSEEARTFLREIWELRKPSTERLCQATEDCAYTKLMETLVYAEEMPAGVRENRAYIEKLFGVNVWARIGKPEGRSIIFDNAGEMMEILNLSDRAKGTLDPEVEVLTEALVSELGYAFKHNEFVNADISAIRERGRH